MSKIEWFEEDYGPKEVKKPKLMINVTTAVEVLSEFFDKETDEGLCPKCKEPLPIEMRVCTCGWERN